jgi:6-phosphogluconolactonase
MNLRIFDDAADLTRAAARTILQKLQPGRPAAIGISGGSTPRPMYELLGGPWRDQLDGTSVTWVLVDERYVPATDPQSNATMIQKTLFAQGMLPGHRFLRFDTELDDPPKTAALFEEQWRAMGIGDLDIVLLGCGDDGHTASLFPGTPVLDVEDHVAAAVFVPRLDQWRVTLTKPVIRAAKLRMVLAAGASKGPILRDVRNGVPHPITVATAGVETWWFVDRAAAGE